MCDIDRRFEHQPTFGVPYARIGARRKLRAAPVLHRMHRWTIQGMRSANQFREVTSRPGMHKVPGTETTVGMYAALNSDTVKNVAHADRKTAYTVVVLNTEQYLRTEPSQVEVKMGDRVFTSTAPRAALATPRRFRTQLHTAAMRCGIH